MEYVFVFILGLLIGYEKGFKKEPVKKYRIEIDWDDWYGVYGDKTLGTYYTFEDGREFQCWHN